MISDEIAEKELIPLVLPNIKSSNESIRKESIDTLKALFTHLKTKEPIERTLQQCSKLFKGLFI
jgi:hypothetical protein